MDEAEPAVEVLPNGPYRVTGAGLVRMHRRVGRDGIPVWERGPEPAHGDPFDL